MASNLPPGVTDKMIPGNTPEEIRFEKFCIAFLNIIPNSTKLSEDEQFDICHLMYDRITQAFRDGYATGQIDSNMDKQLKEISEEDLFRIINETTKPVRI